MIILQFAVFHFLMLCVVAVLLYWLHHRTTTTGKPLWVLQVLALGFTGAAASGVCMIFVAVITVREFAGQRFAEGLFFEGSLYLVLSAVLIARSRIPDDKLKKLRAAILFGVAVAICATGIYSLYFEPWNLKLERHEIVTEKIKHPIRIVLLADIQTDSIGEHERNALRIAKSQNADLILFGGDYLQPSRSMKREELEEDFRTLLRETDLKAPLGVFAIEGNHEEWQPDWAKIFDETGIKPSKRTGTVILEKDGDSLALSLLDCQDSRCSDSQLDDTKMLLPPGYEGTFHVMLGHIPNFSAGKTDADLLLAGHTHGGQVQIPFFGPILTFAGRIPRSQAHGETVLPDGSTLIISNGVGMERGFAPRIRFLCPPQIVVIDLIPK